MKLLTISGVDGSGKSTQLELLRQKLEAEGKKVYYFHAVEFGLANRLSRFFKGQKEFTPGEEKAVTEASWLALFMRKIFLFIDLIRFRFLMRQLRITNYEFLISDRYFYDSLINIAYLSACHCESAPADEAIPFERHQLTVRDPHASLGMTILEHFIPKPDYAFYLSITPEEILKRERVPEQGLEYLKKKIALFEQKKSDWHLVELDANLPKEQILQRALFLLSY